MAVTIDPTLLPELQRYGAFDVAACFNCGNCTAVCPLTSDDATFPRRLIRYAQVGMKEELLSSKELWTCYYCGECSETCPRQAEPGEFVAAARRYAIASYDRTRLARTMYLQPIVGTIIAMFLAMLFAGFMYASHGPENGQTLAFFQYVPEDVIHWMGLSVMIVVGLAGLAGIATMARRIAGTEGVGWRTILGGRSALARSGRALWIALGIESLGQRRYRKDCDAVQEPVAIYRRRWLLHALTMWGFLGLLGATIADYALALIGIKATGTAVPIWYPIRLLGTVAGAMLVYGTTMLLIERLRKANRSVRHSGAADWTLLVLLWVTGVTGFVLELALYLPQAPTWGYAVFLFHVAVAMELVLLAPFMKLAHVIYRPVALFFYALTPSGAGGK
jgi:nitrate reductase gamma subunit/ferredoxin